jgi:HEAT repeat protein
MRSLFWLFLFALAFMFLPAQAQTNPSGNDCQTRIEQALRKLKDANPEVRADAVTELGGFAKSTGASECGNLAKAHARDIAALLRDEHPGVREHALLALIDLNAKEQTQEIVLLLKRETIFWVKRTALDALAKLGAKEYTKDIATLLSNKEEADVRTSAIAALSKLGAKAYAKDIVLLLKDKDFGIRGRGLIALGDLGAKQYAKEIALLLTDETPYIRGYAAQVLTNLGAAEYTKKIALLLMDRDGPVRKTAVLSLKALDYEPSAKEIFKMAADAVVWIEVVSAEGKVFGTGFFVSVDGRILTNKHVIAAAGAVTNITVTMRDGKSFAVGRIMTHPQYDLAMIQLKNPPKNLTYLYFADELPEVGEDLVIIGNPAGLGWSLSEGRVSQIRNDPDGGRNIWIQTDGAINPGNSGGPMLNRYGQVVSIATKGLEKIGGVNVSGLNFGLAISVAKKFIGWL